jgi:ferric-dicitrate binding protein FerR (iron transport regulator)
LREQDREKEAKAALERVARDSETIGASSLARMGRRVGDHFAGRDAMDAEVADPVEVWGRRIGRALSLVGVVALAWWLGVQLHWW